MGLLASRIAMYGSLSTIKCTWLPGSGASPQFLTSSVTSTFSALISCPSFGARTFTVGAAPSSGVLSAATTCTGGGGGVGACTAPGGSGVAGPLEAAAGASIGGYSGGGSDVLAQPPMKNSAKETRQLETMRSHDGMFDLGKVVN